MTGRRSRFRCALLSILAIPFLMSAHACGGDGSATPAPSPAAGAVSPVSGEIRVFAASSLTDAFTAAGERFTEANPSARVVFNFGSSSALATQIKEGAPADLFAAASPAQAATLGSAAVRTEIFATNNLAVAVPTNSKLQAYRDLANPGLKLVLASKDVPAGQYARESLRLASAPAAQGIDFQQRVLSNLKSEEVNVRAALAKVQLGEADAAIVYTTDIAAGSGVRAITIPAEYNVVAEYPLSLLAHAKNSAGAAAFAAYLLSSEGQTVLKEFGFGPAR